MNVHTKIQSQLALAGHHPDDFEFKKMDSTDKKIAQIAKGPINAPQSESGNCIAQIFDCERLLRAREQKLASFERIVGSHPSGSDFKRLDQLDAEIGKLKNNLLGLFEKRLSESKKGLESLMSKVGHFPDSFDFDQMDAYDEEIKLIESRIETLKSK